MKGTELYYSHPIQLRFWDTGLQRYFGGIGFHDYIICGCCGKRISIKEVLKEAEKYDKLDADQAIIECEWLDISDNIIGHKF